MDVLDKYKKAWENQPEDTKKVSKEDIYKITHKKSSSIVKWIFIIGILEFVLLNSSYFFLDMKKSYELYKSLGLYQFAFYSQFVVYAIIFYFLYTFYKNYKNISIVEDTKSLMNKILKTRKTVRNYVFFNIGYLVLIYILVVIASIMKMNGEVTNSKLAGIVIGLLIVAVVMVIIFWLFYQLLYGILLRKLNKNYKELAKLDELN
ncbi:hypothetical protein [Tenacibaculum sp. IB213877]|uniref:hypothetical protein n=1 Tax=Tenacibaculum sp. IB213877 TaxID=3097351 RepID=UPI002A5A3BD8|nr:hypothetical protein [Tenacibaculum sp. IB213877]MDY0779212.1 hypothetical protein [Tenacibaculum sp. IB213877]